MTEPTHETAADAPRRSIPKLVLPLVLVLGFLSAIIWYGPGDGHELFWPKRWGVVQEGAIYRSGEPTLRATRRVVKELGIKTIIDLGAHTQGTWEEDSAQALAEELGVRRYRFGLIGDATGDPNDYVLALRIMNDPAHQPVWVHCAAGSERTGCVVALHRVINEDWDPERAYAETHQYDHRKNPYLKPMFDQWLPSVRTAYLEGGQIPYDQATDALGGAGKMETNGGRTGFDGIVLPLPPLIELHAGPETEPASEGG